MIEDASVLYLDEINTIVDVVTLVKAHWMPVIYLDMDEPQMS
jgi:hypothetical protein